VIATIISLSSVFDALGGWVLVLEVLLPRRLVGSLLAHQDASAKRASLSAPLVKEFYIAEAVVAFLVVEKHDPAEA
jgi:hypothetical protein